jgi:uncharacterized protein YcfJ
MKMSRLKNITEKMKSNGVVNKNTKINPIKSSDIKLNINEPSNVELLINQVKTNEILKKIESHFKSLLLIETTRENRFQSTRGDILEKEREGKNKKTTKKVKEPTSFTSGLGSGFFGDRLSGLLGSVLTGAIGFLSVPKLAGSVGKFAGRGIKYGLIGSVLGSYIDDTVNFVFEETTLFNGDENTQREIAKKVRSSMNVGLVAKLFGVKTRNALGLSLGTYFTDEIMNYVNKLDKNGDKMLNISSDYIPFREEDVNIDLSNPDIQMAIGGFAGLLTTKLVTSLIPMAIGAIGAGPLAAAAAAAIAAASALYLRNQNQKEIEETIKKIEKEAKKNITELEIELSESNKEGDYANSYAIKNQLMKNYEKTGQYGKAAKIGESVVLGSVGLKSEEEIENFRKMSKDEQNKYFTEKLKDKPDNQLKKLEKNIIGSFLGLFDRTDLNKDEKIETGARLLQQYTIIKKQNNPKWNINDTKKDIGVYTDKIEMYSDELGKGGRMMIDKEDLVVLEGIEKEIPKVPLTESQIKQKEIDSLFGNLANKNRTEYIDEYLKSQNKKFLKENDLYKTGYEFIPNTFNYLFPNNIFSDYSKKQNMIQNNPPFDRVIIMQEKSLSDLEDKQTIVLSDGSTNNSNNTNVNNTTINTPTKQSTVDPQIQSMTQ